MSGLYAARRADEDTGVLQRIQVNGAELELSVRGFGEPILFVQTALTADELLPIATQPALADGFRTIVYHRRGYGGSTAAADVGSITRDAADAAAVLDGLGIEDAHVVGLSYSGAIALQLASTAPHRVRTLTLIEPPPVHVPSAAAFRVANTSLLEIRRAAGAGAALDQFMRMVVGPDWRVDMERALPGSVAQMDSDAATFFDADLPALLEWQFTSADAARIDAPVLYVGGTESGPWFAEVRKLMLRWLPWAEQAMIAGADHSLAISHAAGIAQALAGFLQHRSTLERN